MADYSICKCIRTDKPVKRNGKYPIYLRIRVRDKETKIPVGLDIKKELWDSKKREPKNKALLILLNRKVVELYMIQQILSKNTFYLCDSGITIEGINIWGSPISPSFFNWAFNRDRGKEILRHWKRIPKETDILITHTPAYGILDYTARGVVKICLM